jgi:hypothetical protein
MFSNLGVFFQTFPAIFSKNQSWKKIGRLLKFSNFVFSKSYVLLDHGYVYLATDLTLLPHSILPYCISLVPRLQYVRGVTFLPFPAHACFSRAGDVAGTAWYSCKFCFVKYFYLVPPVAIYSSGIRTT